MKHLPTIFALSIVVSYSSACLSGDLSFDRLVGKWYSEKPHPSGALISADLEIKPDHTFSGSAAVNGNVVWQYDGTVTLDGNNLTWKYVHSSKPMPPNATDTDIIISINSDSYSYKAGLGGEVNSYQKVK